MKRTLVKLVNLVLSRFGISVYKKGYDMAAAISRIKKHDFPIGAVIDIGASDGRWSKTAMQYLNNCNFIAIEPLLERKFSLEKIKKSNKNFDYELCAAGEKDNVNVQILVTDDLDGSTITENNIIGKRREIPVKTIDSIISSKGLKGPYLLKFDTHGYEIPILNGAENILKNTSIIIMEVYNHRLTERALMFNEMISYLDKLGFRCYDIADPLLRPFDQTFWQVDLFFTNNNNIIFQTNNYK